MKISTTLMTHALAAVVAATAAWYATATVYKLDASRVALTAANKSIADTASAISDFAAKQTRAQSSLDKFTAKLEENKNAEKDVAAVLRSLRTDVIGVRSAAGEIARKIESADNKALTEYATTCTAVFSAVVEAGERLSIGGAEIASRADGHAVDAQRLDASQ